MSTLSNHFTPQGNAAARALGNRWEQKFIDIVELFGFEGWQVSKLRGSTMVWHGRRYISPDVWILRRGDKQYACEVKHKAPTKHDSIGLEVYRVNSLIELQEHFVNEHGGVTPLYVIHDWSQNGDRDNDRNIIHHWRAQTIDKLQDHITLTCNSDTYYNGEKCRKPTNYYSVCHFTPLLDFLI